ncbi:TetR/AcrR family transcriptional regulator, partial [Actinomycetota bacterium]
MTESVDPRIERTRTVVMRTAIDIVAERGFQGASIDAIAQRSGVARSTIYRHWPDKSDLLLEAIGAAIGDIT